MNRRLSIRILASELNIDKEVVRQILTQDLGVFLICSALLIGRTKATQNGHVW